LQVFISHKIEGDAEFGIQLQKSLAKEDIFGYIAELKQEYDILISEKIKGEIYKSKYLITIITEHSLNSASVHEEIGYAIGKDIPVLLMIEESVGGGSGMGYFDESNYVQGTVIFAIIIGVGFAIGFTYYSKKRK